MNSQIVCLFVITLSILVMNGYCEEPQTDKSERFKANHCSIRTIKRYIRESCYNTYNPALFPNPIPRGPKERKARAIAEEEYYKNVVNNIPMDKLPEGTSITLKRNKRTDNMSLIEWCCTNLDRCRRMRCPTDD